MANKSNFHRYFLSFLHSFCNKKTATQKLASELGQKTREIKENILKISKSLNKEGLFFFAIITYLFKIWLKCLFLAGF